MAKKHKKAKAERKARKAARAVATLEPELVSRDDPELVDRSLSAAAMPRLYKRQISLKITTDILDRVDACARQMGQTRAALINRAI